MPLIILGVAIGLPFLLALAFRVNAVMFFMSVAAGALLQGALGDSLALTLNMAMRNGPTVLIADIALLSLPVLLSVVFLRRTMSAAGMLLQLLPLLASSVAFGALLIAVLPSDVQLQIYHLQFGGVIKRSQDVAVGIAVLMNMLLAWRLLRYHDDGKHGHHR